MGAVVKGC